MKTIMRLVPALLLTAAVSRPVFGQPATRVETIGVVAVAEPPGPSTELADLTQQLRSAAAEQIPGVLEASQLRDRMTGQVSSASLGELDRAYAGALAIYVSGDAEGAVRILRAVIEDLEKLPDSREAFDQWTRAMLRLARAEQTLGRKDEASAIMDRLTRAAPDIKADPNQYPPSFVKQVDDAKIRAKSLPTRTLTVQATAKGVNVFLDGRSIGVAPVTVAVPAGQYRVSGQLRELRIPRIPVDLSDEDQTVTLDPGLLEMLRPSAGPGLALPATDRAKNLVTAGALLGVDKLLAASLVKQADVTYLAGSLYDVRRGMLLREALVRLSHQRATPRATSALAKFLITGEPSDDVITNGPPPPPSPPAPSGSKTLGWTAFSAGVLSAVVGTFAVVEAFSAKSSYNDASSMVQGNTLKIGADPARYNQAVSSGDSAKSKALIGGGVAVGLAAVGGILGYMSYKQSGEVGPFRF